MDGDFVAKTVVLPLGEPGPGEQRLENAGLTVRTEGQRVFVDALSFGSAAEQSGIDFDWEITAIEVPADRRPKQLMYIPALVLLLAIGYLQWHRRKLQPQAVV